MCWPRSRPKSAPAASSPPRPAITGWESRTPRNTSACRRRSSFRAPSPQVKRDGIVGARREDRSTQPHYDAAMDAAIAFAAERGATFVNPCTGEMLLAGQGTVALEILGELPDLATLIAGVGGGGLLGGCASLVRAVAPRVRIVGAQSENTAAMSLSLAAGPGRRDRQPADARRGIGGSDRRLRARHRAARDRRDRHAERGGHRPFDRLAVVGAQAARRGRGRMRGGRGGAPKARADRDAGRGGGQRRQHRSREIRRRS